jgi:UDP-N-acetylmuramate--alanine ligase
MLAVPGGHNRENAAAALAVANFLKIPDAVAHKSVALFSGTWRRLDKRGVTPTGTIVYDDYAHHPTEIRASIEALREVYPTNKIVVVFQPHLYSRTKALFSDFSKCFVGADRVLLLPIYFAREDPDHSISSEKLAQAIAQNGGLAVGYGDFEGAERAVAALNLGYGDILVTMGAGEAYKVADKLFPTLSTGSK